MHHDLNTFWWLMARGTGLTAWWLAATSVFVGLAMAGQVARGRGLGAWLLDVHRYVSAVTLAFVVIHVAALEADTTKPHIALAAVFVPLRSSWRPYAVTWGSIALYLLAVIEVTSLVMDRLPRRAWHAIHLTSVAVFVLVLLHVFMAGTERANVVVQWSALLQGAAFVFLAVYRLIDRFVGVARPLPQRAGR